MQQLEMFGTRWYQGREKERESERGREEGRNSKGENQKATCGEGDGSLDVAREMKVREII